jgi:hypothetical protein
LLANDLAESVIIKITTGKFSGLDKRLWPAVCIERVILLISIKKVDVNTSVSCEKKGIQYKKYY